MILSDIHIRQDKKEAVFSFFIFLFFFFTLLSVVSEPLKYLKYTLPFLLCVFLIIFSKRLFISINNIKQNQRFKYLTGLTFFYLIACISNFIQGFNNLRFYQEFFFVLSPLVFTLLLFLLKPVEDYSKAVVYLFWAISMSFLFEKFESILLEVTNPGLLFDAFLTSELPTESNFAFQFGLFAIVFIHKRMRLYSILSLFLLLLSFKRIAIAGVFVCMLLMVIRSISGNKINPVKNKFFIVICNCLAVSFLFLFFTGAFDEFIESTFGVSSNFITQGRYNIYQDIFAHFGNINILGFGLGSINVYLNTAGYDLLNLHSDVLKVFFELGPVLFVGWIYYFHKWTNSFLSSCLAIYLNILFFTDNVFIYFDVMFVYYILMLNSFSNNNLPAVNTNK